MRASAFLLCLLVSACGDETRTPPSCTPGQSASCTCSSGAVGAQVCNASGVFDACVCEDAGGGTDAGGVDGLGVFVTSAEFDADSVLGVCQTFADGAALGGTWTEWLTTGDAPAPLVPAPDRITADGPWVTVTGELVFRNAAQLRATPLRPIDITENGEQLFGGTVFTGTENGGSAGPHCFNWSTTSLNSVVVGRLDTTDQWTDDGSIGNCENRARVYCFQIAR